MVAVDVEGQCAAGGEDRSPGQRDDVRCVLWTVLPWPGGRTRDPCVAPAWGTAWNGEPREPWNVVSLTVALKLPLSASSSVPSPPLDLLSPIVSLIIVSRFSVPEAFTTRRFVSAPFEIVSLVMLALPVSVQK